MDFIKHPSPNYDSRDGAPLDMLVLHYTGMKSGQEAIERLCDPEAKVSAHYVVEEDGRVFELVDEQQRAWHAGVSQWRGNANINARSIGIEIVNPGHEFGYRKFARDQIASVTELCRSITLKYEIPARNVVAHSDVAPVRKEDPGELFPWQKLAEQGIGLWPKETSEQAETSQLADYGYDISDESKVITAFQRHFRPENLSGQWDAECANRLAGLLNQL